MDARENVRSRSQRVVNGGNVAVIGLTLLALISAILHIRAESVGPKRNVYLFKPLTMICIILIALVAESRVSSFYKYMIVAGLVCSLVGDIFLMLPSDRFVPGLLSFLVAHLFYIAAFASGERVSTRSVRDPFLLWEYDALASPAASGENELPVIVYLIVIWSWHGRPEQVAGTEQQERACLLRSPFVHRLGFDISRR